jgi:hypothetical protein
MTNPSRTRSVTRRTALAGLGAGGLGLTLAATTRPAAAQDAATEMANHPLVGVWLAGANVNELSLVHLDADGSSTFQGGSIATGPDDALTFSGSAMGVWEPVSERGIHITFTWQNRDATGAVTSTVTVDGYPVANEDDMSFWDDGSQAVVIVRDPTGAVIEEINGVPRVAGVRMTPGKPGYEEALAMLASPAAATPNA